MLSRRLLLGGALAAPFFASSGAKAESWPTRPVRVILPGPAGGLIDIGGRAVSGSMQRQLGQPWLIDPRPGANGILAGQLLLASPADGYTLYLSTSGHVALPFLMKAPFDVMADFQPIGMIGVSTALLCVPPTSPANNIAEFVAHAKSNPGKLNYLNPGNGTGAHLIPEQLNIRHGLDVTSISYKGLPPGVQDLLGNRLDFGVVSTAIVAEHVKAGRLKALAVAGPVRIADLPDVATMTEQGAGDLEVLSSLPLWGQKGLAAPIVARLNKAVAASLADADTRKRLRAVYIEPWPMTPSEAGEAMSREHERLGRLIAQVGIKADGGT